MSVGFYIRYYKIIESVFTVSSHYDNIIYLGKLHRIHLHKSTGWTTWRLQAKSNCYHWSSGYR